MEAGPGSGGRGREGRKKKKKNPETVTIIALLLFASTSTSSNPGKLSVRRTTSWQADVIWQLQQRPEDPMQLNESLTLELCHLGVQAPVNFPPEYDAEKNQLIWWGIPIHSHPTKPVKFSAIEENEIVATGELEGATLRSLSEDETFVPQATPRIVLLESHLLSGSDPMNPNSQQIVRFQPVDGADQYMCIRTQANQKPKMFSAKGNTCIVRSDSPHEYTIQVVSMSGTQESEPSVEKKINPLDWNNKKLVNKEKHVLEEMEKEEQLLSNPPPCHIKSIKEQNTNRISTTATTTSSSSFDFFPDRDYNDIFSILIPTEAEADSVYVKIRNDKGNICAEKRCRRDLEIEGLPCDRCLQGNLHVTIEPRNQSRILPTKEIIVSDESKRREICNIRPEHRREGENITITTIKRRQEDGCLWNFRDASGYIGCCYSNRESRGCSSIMQSPACRKGSDIPIIKEEAKTCTLQIPNLDVKDSGNYLSNYDKGSPTAKINLVVHPHPKIVSGPRNITAPIGKAMLELECRIQAGSIDNPKVIWRKDGEELGEFGHQKMRRTVLARNSNSLFIYNITSTDMGNYTCVLKVGTSEIDSQTGQVVIIEIQDIKKWTGTGLVVGLALATLLFNVLFILLCRAQRLRNSDFSKEEGAGDPLKPASGEEDGEERKNVEKGRLEKWRKKLVHALCFDVDLRKYGCLLEHCEGTDKNFQMEHVA